MTEQAKVPAIRFAGFTDPWEQRKLGDIAERVTRKNENNESDLPLTISAQHGLIDQRLFFNAQVASRDMSGYYLLRQGEFAYNKSTSADSPWGAIKRLTRYEKGCVSTLYICFALLNANPDYLVTYYETNRWHKAVQMIAAEGARNHGLLNIAPDDFFDTMVSLPESQAEQQTIGAFFSRLDSLITLHQRKYDKLVIFKKSMLEKMFPKDGESVPEIRFAGFTDPWEQRKLGEIVSIGAGAPPSAFSAGNFLYVKVDDLNESSHFQFDSAQRVDANTAVKPIRKGSIIFAKRGAAILGNKVRVLGKTAYIDTNMMALEPRGVDADFLWLFINQTGLYRIADTSTIPQINNKHIEPYPVDIPNMAEQQAIGTFFSRLDDLITLHQRKYDKLVIFKKSMLEKMFPKDGESVPEIRFAGFTDPWEQRKLGEIVSIGAGAPPSAFSAGNFLYVKVDDLNESSHFQFDSAQRVDANTAVKPIRKGSIIFAKRGAAILGNKVRVLGKTAYIDTNMMALEPRGVDADFLWLFINQTGLYRIADTSTIPQINNKHIEPYPVDIPNMAEQQAIGTFFSRLDDLITLHQRKLELLQNIKKSLLDKMFV